MANYTVGLPFRHPDYPNHWCIIPKGKSCQISSDDRRTQNCGIKYFVYFYPQTLYFYDTFEHANRNSSDYIDNTGLYKVLNETDIEAHKRINDWLKANIAYIKQSTAVIQVSLNNYEYNRYGILFIQHGFKCVYHGLNPNSRNEIKIYQLWCSPNKLESKNV